MIESVADTPWFSGKIRVALEWGSAPELNSGVPLHSGQCAARRLKKASSHANTLKIIDPMITFTASWVGLPKNIERAVSVVITPT